MPSLFRPADGVPTGGTRPAFFPDSVEGKRGGRPGFAWRPSRSYFRQSENRRSLSSLGPSGLLLAAEEPQRLYLQGQGLDLFHKDLPQ